MLPSMRSFHWLLRKPHVRCIMILLVVVLIFVPLLRLFGLFGQPSQTQMLQRHQTNVFQNQIKEVRTFNKLITHRPIIVVYEDRTQRKDGCHVATIDPFNAQVTKYMRDFGEHHCQQANELRMTNNQDILVVSGYNINFIESAEIIADSNAKGFRHLGYEKLLQPRVAKLQLSLGQSGSIVNVKSSRCIAPVKYDVQNPPVEIDLQYTSSCVGDQALFTFLSSGIIFHNSTKKCITPVGGSQNPPSNTKLVLSTNCSAHFNVLGDGVLRHSGGSCVHPLWGGASPEEGQKLCLYPDCMLNERIVYKFHVMGKNAFGKSSLNVSLTKELNYLKIHYTDGNPVSTFTLMVQPKPNIAAKVVTSPNIFVVTLDEVSAAHFQRKLPFTYTFMKDEMKFLQYDVHSAIAQPSKENLFALLTGTSAADTTTPSLYDISRSSGYVSLFSADQPTSLFNSTRADHCSIPLFTSMKKYYDLNAHAQCVASQPIYELTFSYLLSFIQAYPNRAKFAVAVLTEITQRNYNFLGYMDNMFKDTLKNLKDMKNTIIFVHTLKGSLTGKLGQLHQGILEHRRPYLAAYVSQDIQHQFVFKKERTQGLTSPLDIYSTIKEILTSQKSEHSHGKSLFENTKARTCAQAGVSMSMCPCT